MTNVIMSTIKSYDNKPKKRHNDMTSKKDNGRRTSVSRKPVQAVIMLVFLLCAGGTTSCSKFMKVDADQNDSTALDSTATAVKETVKVDPSLVKGGDMGYLLYESNNSDDGIGNDQIVLRYTIEHGKCTNYCGTLSYPNKKTPDDKHEIEVLGEVAEDGGLTFSGKLDNVLYSLHIKNTHNTASVENGQRHEAEMTVGDKTRTVYMKFEQAGDNGD